MVFNVLFGSRIVPQAARTMARGLATQTAPALQRTAITKFATPPASLAIRAYGTRSLWNVSGGKMWFAVATCGMTVVAFAAQEILGPYIIFHEPM